MVVPVLYVYSLTLYVIYSYTVVIIIMLVAIYLGQSTVLLYSVSSLVPILYSMRQKAGEEPGIGTRLYSYSVSTL